MWIISSLLGHCHLWPGMEVYGIYLPFRKNTIVVCGALIWKNFWAQPLKSVLTQQFVCSLEFKHQEIASDGKGPT